MTIGIIFDLDGTLWDASESTACAWTEVFRTHELNTVVRKADIQAVAGRPYLECLEIICPKAFILPEYDQLVKNLSVAEKFWMQEIGGEFYPGALEGVRAIAEKYPTFLVSNCNDWYLNAFLEHSMLQDTFLATTCYGVTGKPKDENIRNILLGNNVPRGLYIGDTSGDMKASLAAGVGYIHVAFGFGGEEMPNSEYVINDYKDMAGLLSFIADYQNP